MDTKKKSVIAENIIIVIMVFSLIFAALYAYTCYLGNKENVDACIKQTKNEIASFIVSTRSKASALGTEYYDISQNISGLGEDERVLYALKSGAAWFLNEREIELYRVVYDFSLKHINSDEFQIVKDAHDLVCESATYGTHLLGHIESNDDSQHSYGALCLEEGAVCAAYARAMVLLCKSVGVEATYISGFVGDSGHAWVIVQLQDSFYHVDPCWNDSGSKITYDYFLLSDSEMEKSRMWEGWQYPSCPESFDYSIYNQ